jgi:N-hydroxyarylamine O-acetyltransferase
MSSIEAPTDLAERYLSALGLTPAAPTLELLAEITRRHVATFAFCSVGPRLGDDLPLAPESLFDRIVRRGRGGYCFEHNGLLFEVLGGLGYDVTVRLARVIHNTDALPGLTHRITHVHLDGVTYVADVGFGASGPPLPVPMPAPGDDPSAWPAGRTHRVVERNPGEFHLQNLQHDVPFSLYRFDLGTYGQADCELGHFYSHRHPDATFVNHLVASRILADEVRSLRNRGYRVVRADGDHDVAVTDADQLAVILREHFGLQVTDDEARRLFDDLPT